MKNDNKITIIMVVTILDKNKQINITYISVTIILQKRKQEVYRSLEIKREIGSCNIGRSSSSTETTEIERNSWGLVVCRRGGCSETAEIKRNSRSRRLIGTRSCRKQI